MRTIAITWVPIETWPGEPRKAGDRRESPFSGTWQRTVDLLDRELFQLGARDVVIQGYFARGDIRMDGFLRAGSRPTAPGIIVSFKAKGADLSFPCDTFRQWKDNLRAIALALEALRKVERYGVTRQNEQYKGWAKLPPAPDRMRPEDALVFLSIHSTGGDITADTAKSAYRAAAARLHPDNQHTGNPHLFTLLVQAKEALADAYGWNL